MTHAAFALQKAVFAELSADAELAALVGARIYDAAPRAAEFPYVAFGETAERDWGTGSGEGSEHRVTLHAWSRQRGKREALAIAERIVAALHDQALSLDGHLLVNLRREFGEVRRDDDGGAEPTWRALLRFRAVTEPA